MKKLIIIFLILVSSLLRGQTVPAETNNLRGLFASSADSSYLFGNSDSINFTLSFFVPDTPVLHINASFSSLIVPTRCVKGNVSGVHPIISNMVVNPVHFIADPSGEEPTETASLFVSGASSGAALNYSLKVNGATFLNGNVEFADIGQVKSSLNLDLVENYSPSGLWALTKTITNTTVDFSSGTGNIITNVPSTAIVDTDMVELDQRPTQIKGVRNMGSAITAQSLFTQIQDCSIGTTLVDGSIKLIAIMVDKKDTVRGIKYVQITQGNFTSDNNNRVGFYKYNTSTGDLTLVASSANSSTLWKSAVGMVTVAFSSDYVADEGLYFVGLLFNTSATTTTPAILAAAATDSDIPLALDFTNGVSWNMSLGSQTNLPSSFNASTAGGGTTNRLWVALYK